MGSNIKIVNIGSEYEWYVKEALGDLKLKHTKTHATITSFWFS